MITSARIRQSETMANTKPLQSSSNSRGYRQRSGALDVGSASAGAQGRADVPARNMTDGRCSALSATQKATWPLRGGIRRSKQTRGEFASKRIIEGGSFRQQLKGCLCYDPLKGFVISRCFRATGGHSYRMSILDCATSSGIVRLSAVHCLERNFCIPRS